VIAIRSAFTIRVVRAIARLSTLGLAELSGGGIAPRDDGVGPGKHLVVVTIGFGSWRCRWRRSCVGYPRQV